MTTYGLPRSVVQLLKTMEAYRDCLKWNVQEGSHKITLTLSWSFKNKAPPPQTGKEWLWNKIQVVQNKLRLTKSEDGLPLDVCRFLEAEGPTNPPRRPPLRRQFSLGKVTWHANQWQSMPANTRYPSTRQRSLSPTRQSSLSPPPSGRSSFHRGLSNRFSWPGASSPIAIRGGGSLDETQPTQPRASTPLRKSKTYDYSPHSITPIRRSNAVDYPDSVPSLPSFDSVDYSPSCAGDDSQCSSSSQARTTHNPHTSSYFSTNNRIKLTYRTEEEIDKSLEDLVEKTHQENKSKLERIRCEWNKSMREAMEDSVMENDEEVIRENGILDASTGTSDSDPELNIPETNQTVQKCLTACDSILYKHSTLIT